MSFVFNSNIWKFFGNIFGKSREQVNYSAVDTALCAAVHWFCFLATNCAFHRPNLPSRIKSWHSWFVFVSVRHRLKPINLKQPLPSKCNGRLNSLRADAFWGAIVFYFVQALRSNHLDPLGMIFMCPNNQLTDHRKWRSIVHLQYMNCCSLESPSRGRCMSGLQRHQPASCSRFPTVNASKIP